MILYANDFLMHKIARTQTALMLNQLSSIPKVSFAILSPFTFSENIDCLSTTLKQEQVNTNYSFISETINNWLCSFLIIKNEHDWPMQ